MQNRECGVGSRRNALCCSLPGLSGSGGKSKAINKAELAEQHGT